MSRFSIRQRLLALLLGGLLLVWAGMLAFSYAELREEVGELADARMEQSARTLLLLDLKRLRLLARADDGNAHEEHDANDHEADDGDGDERRQHVEFQVWGGDGTLLLNGPGSPRTGYAPRDGHADLTADGVRWRSYALRDPRSGYQVRVFEKAGSRSHIVRKIAGRIAQSLLLALPLLALLIWISVGRALRPLTAMSRAIGARNADNLQALALERVPAEVLPLAHSLNKLLERLSESLDRERSFTADAAHELRTPLAAIQVQAEVALAATEGGQRRRAIEQVITGVHRTTHLVQQLLLLARLDQTDSTHVQPVDLAATATDSAARYADAAARKRIELEVDAHAGCMLRGDPTALSIMVDNLLDNAIKYGRDGGRVVLNVTRDATHLALSVHDDGRGVPTEHRARLFDRFYRIPGSGADGSGLGLAIVDRIARACGGSVTLGEGIAGGLGVTLRFPVATS
jgi:two-component system sensor histidine kinase QseC